MHYDLHHMQIKSSYTFFVIFLLYDISTKMSSLNTTDLLRIFESLDQNGDGLLSIDELNWLLEKTGVHVSREELVCLMGESGLDYDEFNYFYESLLEKKKNDTQKDNVVEDEEEEEVKDLYKAFKVFDLDGDGLISSKELQRVLWRLGMWDNNNGGLDCDRIISKYDVNSDGFVDFEEFKSMMIGH